MTTKEFFRLRPSRGIAIHLHAMPNTSTTPPTSDQLPPAAYTPAVALIVSNLQAATEAAFKMLAELTKTRGEGDEWTRLPSPDGRCLVSHFSRSKINHLISQEKVRAKTVEGGRFYSLSDVRALMKFTAEQN